ncbi:hypothetical protein FDUTEX481_07918 [Tolypothrix sp. PCC 7601]|nr:hypothetical protein FDUTEX481_07918 [Tolypothrix sp. PCC 7601]BAY90712.1 hypothetical protein NIES3275_27290 [Microchaete diplosiphon NIES-3275]
MTLHYVAIPLTYLYDSEPKFSIIYKLFLPLKVSSFPSSNKYDFPELMIGKEAEKAEGSEEQRRETNKTNDK